MNAVVSVVVPSNLQLPAHLQSPDIAAAVAAANAAAAGGVRAGGFPSIGIKANKFSIKDGDETTVLMLPPAAPGQPSLPMMCLEVVVVDANPALSHTFFGELKDGAWVPYDFVEGEHEAPTCRSSNGVTPDADVATKMNAACATCRFYEWGSKISKLTGKPVRACGDSKQLAVVPANDLNYKMLGLAVKAGSLKNWGTYIQALSGRGYGVSTLVTNITFDQTANGVLQFTFNRFLSEAEYLKVNERKTGDDVKLIVAQSRALAPAAALPAPAANLGLPAPEVAAPVQMSPTHPTETAPIQTGGFGGAGDPYALVPEPAAAPPVTAGPSATDPFAGLEPHVALAVNAVGGLATHAGMRTYNAMTGLDYMAMVAALSAAPDPAGAPASAPAPATAEPPKRSRRTRAEMEAAKQPAAPAAQAADLSHIPPEIMTTINAVGANSAAGQALIAAYPAPTLAAAAPVAAPQPQAAPVVTQPAAATPSTGFGAAPAVAVAAAPTTQVMASGASLAEKLRAKLGLPAGAA